VGRITSMLLIVVAVIALGSTLFALVEQRPFVQGLYFTLTTLSTVGYGDIVPTTSGGRWVAMGLLAGGGGIALYLMSVVVPFLIEGRLRGLLGVRRMKKAIERMEQHFIVCGYGKLGKVVASHLEAVEADFVVIEADAQKAAEARARGLAVVEGDATQPETLTAAGLPRAAGVTATMADDAENLYIAISARSLRAEVPVVCRTSSERAQRLFEHAGIRHTVSTDEMSANRLVGALMRPHVVEFIDEITRPVEGRPSLQAVRVDAGAPLIGQSLVGARLRDEYGVVVVAIRRDGAYLPNPRGEEVLRTGDVLILIGDPRQVARMRAQVQGVA
jgi:voltage-gated potassium channel